MVEAFVNDLVMALASNGGRVLAEAASTVIGKLAMGLREKFGKDPAARGTLEIVIDDAEDGHAKAELATLIDQRIRQDPEFAAWLRTEWGLVQPLLTQIDGPVANTVSGGVSGTVVQARDIAGGVHIGTQKAVSPSHKEL
jgi:hypothetical protein